MLSKEWRVRAEDVSGGSDGGDESGGNGGGDPTSEPSGEAKSLNTKFNELGANGCEVRYILGHFTDIPDMAFDLYINKEKAEQYMIHQKMAAANSDGTSPENALKHGVISALNYCSFGEQHAKQIGDLHEMCNGVNQNKVKPELELKMDRANNTAGFEIAKSAGCTDKKKLLEALYKGYKGGKFVDINGNPTK